MAIFSSNAMLFSICTLIWGSTWIAITYQVHEMHVMLSVGLRFALAAIIIGLWCIVAKVPLRIPLSQHKLIAVAGIFLYTFDYSFLYAAQQHMISALLAVLSSTVIYFNVILRRVLMGKHMRLEVIIGATIGMLGIVLIFLPEFAAFSAQQGIVVGLMFASASFFSAAVGNVVSEKVLAGKVTVLQMNFWAMTYGVCVTTCVAFLSGASLQFPSATSYYVSLLYLAVFGSVIAFGAYMRLLTQIGADKSAYVVLVYPVVALLISTVFEGYQWSLVAVLGVMFVLIGNAVAMGKLNRILRIPYIPQ
ncbi:MAG: EamA family transporter [Glaciecola sp.]